MVQELFLPVGVSPLTHSSSCVASRALLLLQLLFAFLFVPAEMMHAGVIQSWSWHFQQKKLPCDATVRVSVSTTLALR